MDVGTAAVALNTLLGAVTKISKSDVANTSVANMQQNKNNFLNENADLIKVLDANKLNSLFMVNGNMIALKKDVIVEPLLVITESAFDSKVCEKVGNMFMDVFSTHYSDSFNSLQNVYGLDTQTIITVLGTDNGFNKLKGLAATKLLNVTIDTIADLTKESGLSTSFDELTNLQLSLEVAPEKEEDDVTHESSLPFVGANTDHGTRGRIVSDSADIVKTKDGVLGMGIYERRVILKIRAYSYGGATPDKTADSINDAIKKDSAGITGNNTGNLNISIPITIKARMLKVTVENIAAVSAPSKKYNTLTTWLDVRAGISSVLDYFLQREAVKKYRKNILKGNEFLKIINERKISAYSKVATTSVVGFELNYSMLIMTQRDKTLLEKYLNLNIFKEDEKNEFMASTYALMGAVLDDSAEMCTFLTPLVRGINSVTYREIGKLGGQKETDVGELLMAMVKSRMLG